MAIVPSRAQAQAPGFQVERYEATAPGNWLFLVDHPWYSSTRRFAIGFDLDYGHNPLVFGMKDATGHLVQQGTVVADQVVARIGGAVSFWDRVQLSLSVPATLYEAGSTVLGVSPVHGAALSDPRIGAMVRLWNHVDDSISLHAGFNLWIPVGAQVNHAGDTDARFLPKIVAAGLVRERIRWSLSLGYLVRARNGIGPVQSGPGAGAGHELQIGAGAAWTNKARTFTLGPELLLSSVANTSDFFGSGSTSLEGLVGAKYEISRSVMLGAALSVGFLRMAGTPDVRLIFNIAYAPQNDRDGDGIADVDDACPDLHGTRSTVPENNGCPPDTDGDGVRDGVDLCPLEPKGETPDPRRIGCPRRDCDHDGVWDDEDLCCCESAGSSPDPARKGCPLPDRDKDGVPDAADVCPDVHKGEHPDPARLGCPMLDRDGDGVTDDKDICPDVPAGAHPDPKRAGCPEGDRDGDGVLDSQDECPDTAAGATPDPAHPGCPTPDRDKDGVPDAVDACPDVPGAPNPDPSKHGCPGLVLLEGDMLKIINPVFFATNKDIILPKSTPVLTAVANALSASPQLKKVRVEGHTDNKGVPIKNLDLSDRRARSVVRWLIGHGIAAERLEAKGFGQTKPLVANTNEKNRSVNRRVQFRIVDPVLGGGVGTPTPGAVREAAPGPGRAAPGKRAPLRRGKRRAP